MSEQLTADLDITIKEVRELTSTDAISSFLTRLGYPTGCRKNELASAYGFKPETTDTIKQLELLSEDDDDFFRVIFVQLKSITAKARNEIVRNLGKRNVDHLLILTSDFSKIEFVLIDKETKQRGSPGGGPGVQVIPRVVTVDRKSAGLVERRILRRLTWTGKDGLDQFDKIRSVFQSAHYAEQYFTNRALFADHYLVTRLREDAGWKDNPSEAYAKTKDLMQHARESWANKDEQLLRNELFDSAWKLLGFKAKVNKPATKDHLDPDYLLKDSDGKVISVAYVYRWDRWLDGPDLNDEDTPDENPGAAVVSTLAKGDVRWVIVTNGKLWRLYSKDAHSRSTNFYEVDLEEALIASDETDPNEAFRYWWLFFKADAFADIGEADQPKCWLDSIVEGSRDYAKRLGERLKERIFVQIFPHLAQGFLHDRKKRLGLKGKPSEDELRDVFEATLTLLYRLLFLLYAEARELLPIGETSYQAASLKRIKEEIGSKAGDSADGVPDKLKAYSESDTNLYDHLVTLFTAMDKGDSLLNVPTYNGGLFITEPDDEKNDREHRIAAFLRDHKVPDRFLALAIDRLSRDQDEKTLGLVFIDYKSLEVRHLGSIYEGLLEFKLKIADEDLATKKVKNAERYVSLSEVPTRGRKASASAVVKKGQTYLSNDKAERKATGSYYTPDPIVEYIVEHTVGPVLQEKLDALKPELDKAAKTFHRQLGNAKANKKLLKDGTDEKSFAASKTYAEHRDLVDKIFDMKVLDPAMGSGHFLVEAVDFITDKLLEFLNPYPNNPVRFMLNKTRQSILDALGTQNVAVDPDKLTDINLLKRHVLKRCIYGVDLNPMAVELAKVSLWLDAFTLGAPLSFLDHHLRCGNSLIGATFEDLKKATEGQLLGVDYEPLMRAIRHVLFVNEMSDATAAEVHKSADEYAKARGELSGYRVVLDLLVGDRFVHGRVQPSSLIRDTRLDLTTRDTFIAALTENARRTVADVETVARRPDLSFFHWEIEFPEVFFGFADSDQRQIKHKNDIAAVSAGFNAVVGNPPYFELSDLPKDQHTYLKSAFSSFVVRKSNIYLLFWVRAFELTQVEDRFGFITSNKFLCAVNGGPLRKLLLTDAYFALCVDFHHARVFGDDVETYSIIGIGSKTPPDNDTSIQVSKWRHRTFASENRLSALNPVDFRHYEIPCSVLKANPAQIFDVSVEPEARRIIVWMEQHPSRIWLDEAIDVKRGLTTIGYKHLSAIATRGQSSVNANQVESFVVFRPIQRITKSIRVSPFHTMQKILIKDISKTLTTAFDSTGLACPSSLYYGFAKRDIDPRALVGLLNSRLISFYYSQKFQSTQLTLGWIRVKGRYLELVPLVIRLEDRLSQITGELEDAAVRLTQYVSLEAGRNTRYCLENGFKKSSFGNAIVEFRDLLKKLDAIVERDVFGLDDEKLALLDGLTPERYLPFECILDGKLVPRETAPSGGDEE